MSGHPQGGHYDDGYGHDSYYDEGQGYYDNGQDYGHDGYYDERQGSLTINLQCLANVKTVPTTTRVATLHMPRMGTMIKAMGMNTTMVNTTTKAPLLPDSNRTTVIMDMGM